jgi:hypothetical protein
MIHGCFRDAGAPESEETTGMLEVAIGLAFDLALSSASPLAACSRGASLMKGFSTSSNSL